MEAKSGSDDKPGFFKVLLGDFSERLLIPPAFSKFFRGKPMPQKIKLHTKDKRVWEVELVEKNDKMLYFEKGWDNFVDDHFLEVGDFVIFNYAGRSMFNCTMCGRNACEKSVITKPPSDDRSTRTEAGGSKVPRSEKDSCGSKAPTTEKVVTRKKKQVEYSTRTEAGGSKVPRSEKDSGGSKAPTTEKFVARKKKPVEYSTRTEAGRSKAPRSESASSSARSGGGDNERKSSTENRKKTLPKDKVDLAFQRVKGKFQSENPFVLVAMQPSYLIGENKTALNLNGKFIGKHLNEEHNNVILRIPRSKQSWHMKYYLCEERSLGVLNQGWRHFAFDNHLAVGDVCVLELIDESDNIMMVHIYRNTIK